MNTAGVSTIPGLAHWTTTRASLRGAMQPRPNAGGLGLAPPGTADRAREAAEDFVALAFIEPILEQLRESTQAAPPFAPTNGEKQFRAMLDATLAREITRAARFPLVDRLAHDLRRHGSTEANDTTAARA